MSNIEQTIEKLEKKRAALVERGVRLVRRAPSHRLRRPRRWRPESPRPSRQAQCRSRDPRQRAGQPRRRHRPPTTNSTQPSTLAATAEDRQRAADLQDEFEHFIELAKKIDSALGVVVAASNELKESMDQIHRLGSPTPTSQQFLVLGEMALHGRLMFSAWPRGFRHLPPKDRHNLGDLAAGWARSAAPNIAQRLGEQNEEAA